MDGWLQLRNCAVVCKSHVESLSLVGVDLDLENLIDRFGSRSKRMEETACEEVGTRKEIGIARWLHMYFLGVLSIAAFAGNICAILSNNWKTASTPKGLISRLLKMAGLESSKSNRLLFVQL